MKISILVSDMSKNTLGRPYLLANVLKRRYEVEIIGPCFGEHIWPPCDTGELEYKVIPGAKFPAFLGSMRKMSKLISGDVLYAAAPRLPDYGLALLKRLRRAEPVVLDMDEWQVGMLLAKGRLGYIKAGIRHIRTPNSELYYWLMERMIPLADKITVASNYLLKRFGGIKVPHGRNTELLDPKKYQPDAERLRLKLEDKSYIVFLGTPAPHKGVDDIIEALRLLNRKELRLLLVGGDPEISYVRRYVEYLEEAGGEWVEIRGYCPVSDIPRYLSAASLVVLPQHPTQQYAGQVPAKLLDAMAMAKPIISTTVSEIPEILQGCGWLVKPKDTKALAETIDYVLSHPDEARSKGEKARARCVEFYSWDAIELTLASVFASFK
jgi:glycosyltransferase involved in cell wall biosynthesis